MREIKFRAMIKGALYPMPVVLIDFANGVEVEDIGDDRLDHYFYEWDKVEALEQFTGLHDKNGKEIYEGDIVKVVSLANDHNQRGATSTMQVSIFEGCAILVETKTILSLSFRVDHTIEIIGKIHETKEPTK